MLLLATGASAQWRYRDYDRDQGRSYGRYQGSVVDRALSDLDHARSYGRVDNHERKHFDQARKDLLRFRDNWAKGKFDKDRLDGAIENIQDLVDSNQVHPRERQILGRDLTELRDFRASRGYRGRPY